MTPHDVIPGMLAVFMHAWIGWKDRKTLALGHAHEAGDACLIVQQWDALLDYVLVLHAERLVWVSVYFLENR